MDTVPRLQFLLNLTHEQSNCTVYVENCEVNFLRYDISKQYFNLSFAELKEYSVQCQTLKPGNTNCKIKIAVQDTSAIFEVNKKIKITDEPYLFWTGQNAFNILSQCERHLSSYTRLACLSITISSKSERQAFQSEFSLKAKKLSTKYKIGTL